MTSAAAAITGAARSWLDSLDDRHRRQASFPFATPERYVWAYTPGTREGLAVAEMLGHQRVAASAIIAASMSPRTAGEIVGIMELEVVLGQLERSDGRSGWQRRDPELYWFAVFGEPGGPGPWSWRVGGHHVALSVVVDGDEVISSTPSFLGSNPAVVPSGPTAGARVLTGEETLGRALLRDLTPTERKAAVVSGTAPADILTGTGRLAELRSVPSGVRHADLGAPRRVLLEGLIRHYLGRLRPDLAADAWERLAAAGVEAITFAWAGPDAPGRGHYYAVRGPSFVIEYDNTQNGANHIHAVWRDLERDWGGDPLADHLAAAHGDRT